MTSATGIRLIANPDSSEVEAALVSSRLPVCALDFTILYGESVHGCHTFALDEPKMEAIGRPAAAAICIGPPSLPTKTRASPIKAISSFNESPKSTQARERIRALTF